MHDLFGHDYAARHRSILSDDRGRSARAWQTKPKPNKKRGRGHTPRSCDLVDPFRDTFFERMTMSIKACGPRRIKELAVLSNGHFKIGFACVFYSFKLSF
jgi:hypothetical protein